MGRQRTVFDKTEQMNSRVREFENMFGLMDAWAFVRVALNQN
jgi:hypothetical protein